MDVQVPGTTREAELRRFLADNFPLGVDATELDAHESLLGAGVIDSVGVLELVGWVESTYGVQVADEELVSDNFDSIDGILRFVERKRDGSQ